MNNEKGQGLVEYLILVCLIAVSAIAIVRVVGTNIKEQYRKVSYAIQGKGDQGGFTEAGQGTYKKRGLNDFTEE